jgi:acetyl esterase/lipase
MAVIPRRRGRLRSTVLLFGLLGAGCFFDPWAWIDDNLQPPQAQDWIDTTRRLGILEEMLRVSQTLPEMLNEVAAVDRAEPYDVEHIADVPYRVTPQRVLTLDVYRPITNNPALRRAVVLYMGGGFVVDGDFDTMGVWARFLASRGIVAFNTRQRLLTEDGVSRRDVFTDAIAAARFIAADGPLFGADPNRIATMGRSTGAQLALLVGMAPTPEHFGPAGDPDVPLSIKAVVDIFGSVDDSRYYTSLDFSLLPRDALASLYGGTPARVPEAYAESAPLNYVRPGLPAVMIVHGWLDSTIPITHSILLANALEDAGNDVERFFDPEAGHVIGWGILSNDGFGRAMLRIIPFLKKHL